MTDTDRKFLTEGTETTYYEVWHEGNMVNRIALSIEGESPGEDVDFEYYILTCLADWFEGKDVMFAECRKRRNPPQSTAEGDRGERRIAMSMRLYKVRLRGLHGGLVDTDYGTSYVVAEDPTSAYAKVKKFVDEKDLGFQHDRELGSVTLLADEWHCSGVRTMLFL